MSDYGVFIDMLSGTPEFKGAPGEKAAEVLAAYHASESPEISGTTTLEEADRRWKAVERYEAIVELGVKLADAVNSGNPKDVGKALFVGLSRQHRTLQAQSVAAMIEFLRLYKENSYDGRNRVAVVAAERITQVVDEECIYIPLI